ncbi:MAG: hypothetical protein M1822_009204 [Bathelium mastoideum]|nr:MAG: hypothetical protein M1822_009204 [Bathelium mastoideum]
MKVATSTMLFGAASAAVAPQQQVLKAPSSFADMASSWAQPLRDWEESLKSLTGEARQLWDEMAMMFPESFDKSSFFSSPKPHTRKADSEWDYIMSGEDVQNVWVTNAQGDKEREVGGKLESYDLRTRKVDPASLGVDTVKQYSGYLDDKENDKHLFYWFFESRNDPENDPVVLWLNGGPGCSSLTGLFMELGPSFINKSRQAVYNPSSWNANASVIFLDQPVNVGFSYSSGSVSNTVAAGKDVYALMTLFFKQFPEYAKQSFHIAGESYAGHYIPVFTSEILSHKKRNINLQSILIGNGLTDGLTQYAYYKPMACGEGSHWPAVLSESECQSMEDSYPRCASLVQSCYDSGSVWSCVPASIYCNNAMIGPYQRTGLNPYDVRVKCGNNPLCYEELDWISEWLNQAAVKKALGAEVDSYEGCNMDINRNFLFQGDWMQPFHRLVPGILEQIPVLIYAGDADYICNWLGNHAWTEALEWKGKKAFNSAPLEDLKLSQAAIPNAKDNVKVGDKIGLAKAAGNFSFISIHAGGHMVPHDQPVASLDFFNRWLSGEWIES